jgi:Xaa-Pro aminopeptidase
VSTRSISPQRYATRLEQARALLPGEDAAALLIGAGADLQWLTGYAAMASERLTMLVVPADGKVSLVVPRLERPAAAASTAAAAGVVELVTWEKTASPFELVAQLLRQARSRPEIQLGALGGTWGTLGGLLLSDRLWASFVLRLQAVLPDAAFGLASAVLSGLRAIKDAEEIELLRRAAAAADRVVEEIAAGRLVGRSEADISHEVRDRLVAAGHDSASFAIVASGPNSASPHHEATERVVQAGEPIVLDIGGQLDGYCSDTTRTLWVRGEGGHGPDEAYRRLHAVLQDAQASATAAVAPGVPCEEIDAAARSIIDAAGFGAAFTHRTGHGIGLDGHEEPYLVAGNDDPLDTGNAFSVEPGIYLEGQYGARIEDIVVCAGTGPDVLNRVTRDLMVVQG